MGSYFDDLETRDPAEREAAQFAALRRVLAVAMPAAPGLARHLEGHDPSALSDRGALADLPVLRKSDLAAFQAEDPPFGGLTTRPAHGFRHLFMSPGPIFEPGSDAPDWWRAGRFLHAAGIGAGDVVQNCFAYHLTPAGMIFESGIAAVGATCIPAGTGNTEQQVAAAQGLGATAYAGTPDYLKVILDKADELGVTLAITKAAVGGGALFPSLREAYAARGISRMQSYATADLGNIAYEARNPDGSIEGMVVDEGLIVEIVRPGTGDPVPEGDVGEVVVTSLNPDYPLVRFATGDLSAVLPGQSPCGRTNMRIRGWMGRADQTTKVKGMFVRPEQIAAIVARHPEVVRARAEISRDDQQDVLALSCEVAENAVSIDALAATTRDVLKLRADVLLVAVGSLPNDGKVIDDKRSYS
ncbi:MAG: phenylacetate--CoA ligase family protein [Pseudomonadota bacterium]